MNSVSQGSGKQVSQGGDLSLFHDILRLNRAEKAEDDGHRRAAALRDPLTHLPDAWAAQTQDGQSTHVVSPAAWPPYITAASGGEASPLGSQHANQQCSSKSGRSCLISHASPRKSNVALHTLGQSSHKSLRFKGRDNLPGEMPRNLRAKSKGI